MSVDRTKVLQSAQKHLGKGNYDKAIVEYQKLVKADPNDVRTWLKIGDLYMRKGAKAEAIETYSRVAQRYGDQGFFLKAVAVYKQIIKLDASQLDAHVKLAEMYEMLQLLSDALTAYEHVASVYAQNGQVERALETLQKMTNLDPENIPARIKFAEALSKAGKATEAAEEFEAGASLLKDQGRFDDYIKVAERLLYHRPDATEVANDLAKLYLERNDAKRALGKLQLCFKAAPKDTTTLELLAEAFTQLGQLPKTISVYREIARIHQDGNEHTARATILRKILTIDPSDAEARTALAAYASESSKARRSVSPPASAVVQPPSAPPEPSDVNDEDLEFLEDDELLMDDESIVGNARRPSRYPATSEAAAVPADIQREAQIARLLTECDVFMRYGLRSKVIEQLKSLLQFAPDHIEARERLKNVYLEENQPQKAISELMVLAGQSEPEDRNQAIEYVQEALQHDPNHSTARAKLEELEQQSQQRRQQQKQTPATQSASEEGDVFFVDEEDAQAANLSSDAPLPLLGAQRQKPTSGVPGDVDVLAATMPSTELDERLISDTIAPAESSELGSPSTEVRIETGDFGSAPPTATEIQAFPVDPDSPTTEPSPYDSVDLTAEFDPLAPMTPEEFEEVPLRPSDPQGPNLDARQSRPGEVEELLDEADFFVAQGLYDDALSTLREGLASHPNHPIIMDKIQEIDESAASADYERQLSSQKDMEDRSFQLAEKLAEDFEEQQSAKPEGSDVIDVDQVFEKFKKGVEEQVSEDDSDTHFDLGIAYKEMGLFDDAINEFKLCLPNTERPCDVEMMIGLCYIEKGEVTEGIARFKQALYLEKKTEQEELSLYFELGVAYEKINDPKEAIYFFQKVQKREPSFRDVAQRLERLAAPQTPETTPAEFEQDDIDRAFDDLLGED